MKHIKLMIIVIVAASLMLPFDVVSARGGGGRGGWSGGGGRGGHGGGGWGWGIAGAAIAGVLIGAATQPQTVVVEQQQYAPSPLPYGTEITSLPPGCVARNVNGTIVYQCGPALYRPYFGSNGTYYEVVQQ